MNGVHSVCYKKVLVVGTTSDYIHMIRLARPGNVLFLTDYSIREQSKELPPHRNEEVLCDTDDPDKAVEKLIEHIRSRGIAITGVACFDCESMKLAALAAQTLKLPYPPMDAIRACRNKFVSKKRWRAGGLRCPRGEKVTSESGAVEFFIKSENDCVLKPVDGSGSELVFCCKTADECKTAWKKIASSCPPEKPVAIAEKHIRGTEYSCDFIVDESRVLLIRMARKLHVPGTVFGTTMAYELIDTLPGNIPHDDFISLLRQAAKALNVNKAICMLDFIVRGNAIYLLELAPRPGGDCLPWLIKKATGMDILSLTLDFVQGRPVVVPPQIPVAGMVGLRIHSQKSGILKRIDTTRLENDPRIHEIYLKQQPGTSIELPPADYDSWNLGHILFKPYENDDLFKQCVALLSYVTIAMENKNDDTALNVHGQSKRRTCRKNLVA